MSNSSQLVIPVDFTGSSIQSTKLPWTRVVGKFGDIVRHQINMKLNNVPSESSESWINSVEASLQEEGQLQTCTLLAQRLESTLREARLKSVLNGEVLIPCNLTYQIAVDVIKMSEVEPCGLKGCVIYIFLDDKSSRKRIGKVSCDPHVVSTFELFLTLRQNCGDNWLRNLVRRLGRTSPLVLSDEYSLNKRKLYRSSSLED